MPSISTVRLSVVLYVQLSDTPGDVTGSVPVWARPRLSVSASDRTDQVNQVDCTESMGGKQWFIRIGATTHITCFKVRKCPINTVHESTGHRSLGKKEKIRGRKAVSEHTPSMPMQRSGSCIENSPHARELQRAVAWPQTQPW
jgi:hypothetical protein